MSMRNLTVTLPAELIRRAKVVAAMRDTSVSALVAGYLQALADQDDDYDQLWRDEQRLMSEGLRMRVGDLSWTRAATHER